MVSLESANRAGRSAFSTEPLINNDEEGLIDSFGAGDVIRFKKMHTVWSSIIVLFVLIVVEVLLYIVPLWCDDNHCIIDTSSALVCLQSICWSLLLINDQFLRWQHRSLTKTGHLLFYRKTQVLKHGALYVFSLGNLSLLLLAAIFHEFCFTPACEKYNCCKPIIYYQIIMTLEVVIAFISVGKYLGKTIKFNLDKPLPDVNQDDLFASFSQIQIPQTEVGYKDEESVEDIMERQADLIYYLKQHNENLGRKIIQLTNELKQKSG